MRWLRSRVRLDPDLLERVEARVAEAGYASVEEFVRHCIEKELRRHRGGAEDDGRVRARLRGLGYIE